MLSLDVGDQFPRMRTRAPTPHFQACCQRSLALLSWGSAPWSKKTERGPWMWRKGCWVLPQQWMPGQDRSLGKWQTLSAWLYVEVS